MNMFQASYLLPSLMVCVIWLCLMPAAARLITVKRGLQALLLTPVVQLLLFVFILQADSGGNLLTGDLRCSGMHGGSGGACWWYEATLEAMLASLVFSFTTFGLLPLAVFLSLLFCFLALDLRRARRPTPRTDRDSA